VSECNDARIKDLREGLSQKYTIKVRNHVEISDKKAHQAITPKNSGMKPKEKKA
jgi:hypothetical protein